MMEVEDKLVMRFLAEQQQEITDSGFTERVMQNIPQRRKLYNAVWTVFCLTTFVIVFIHLGGWEQAKLGFDTWIQPLTPQKIVSLCSWNNLLCVLITYIVYLALAVYNVCETE